MTKYENYSNLLLAVGNVSYAQATFIRAVHDLHKTKALGGEDLFKRDRVLVDEKAKLDYSIVLVLESFARFYLGAE